MTTRLWIDKLSLFFFFCFLFVSFIIVFTYANC